MNKKQISSIIDHTLLAADAGENQIKKLCKEAADNGFASVCVNPVYVPLAAEELKTSEVKVCTVVGFPLGSMTAKAKAFEAKDAVSKGAHEVDMVVNIGAAKDGRFPEVRKDIAAVVKASKKEGEKLGRKVIVKVILETCLLDDKTIVKCCKFAQKAGADFVKTSTGFATPKAADGSSLPNGATVHHVELMRKTVGPDMGVKASGGIRSAETAAAMVAAGANRIGTSSGIKIIDGWQE